MAEDWLCEKLGDLNIKEKCLPTLTEIREHLKANPDLDAKIIHHLLKSPEIYNCLEEDEMNVTDNTNPIEIVYDILAKCLENLSFVENKDLHNLLQRSLMHKHRRIRALVLNTLLKELYKQFSTDATEECEPTCIISIPLLQSILLAAQEEEKEVGRPAFRILSLVLKYYLDVPAIKEMLLEALKKDGIVRCRLYEFAVTTGLYSAGNLKKVEFILDHALSELDNDDELVKANIMHMLVPLAESNPGLAYLEKRQVFEVLAKRIEDMEHNPINPLHVPAILKFFGKISSAQPQKVIEGYPHMMYCIFKVFKTTDYSMLPIAFDALANLGHTEHGIYLLEAKFPNEIKELLETYPSYIRNLPTSLRVRAMDTLNYIFKFEKEEVFAEIREILQRWFTHFTSGTNNMQFLMVSCRMPFVELRYSTLNFVRSLCYYSWGIEALKNTVGFVEYLLDRSVNHDDGEKYTKYCIINLLADSGVFDPQTNIQLLTYVAEGPYFVRNVAQVDIVADV